MKEGSGRDVSRTLLCSAGCPRCWVESYTIVSWDLRAGGGRGQEASGLRHGAGGIGREK